MCLGMKMKSLHDDGRAELMMSFTKAMSSAKVSSIGLSGATRLRINWYVAAPQELRRIALRLLPSSEMPFATKY